MSEPLELRPEVAAFAQAMERKLRKNDHRPGWKGESVDYLLARLGEERGELLTVLEDVKRCERVADETARMQILTGLAKTALDEAADVANFAMMIADVCGGLGVSA